MRPRWPRVKEHGVAVYRLREGIDEDLRDYGEEGFIEMNSRDDRPDIAKVVGAIHLIGRRYEVATLARIAEVLDWSFPRVRTALSALRERKVVRVKRILNPYPRWTYWPCRGEKAPMAASDFLPAHNAEDPRGDEPAAACEPDTPADRATVERVMREISEQGSGRGEAA